MAGLANRPTKSNSIRSLWHSSVTISWFAKRGELRVKVSGYWAVLCMALAGSATLVLLRSLS